MRPKWIQVGIVLTVLIATAFTANTAAAQPDSQGGRPNLRNEQTFLTTHFMIHYTVNGVDAVDPTDADGSGVPDYIELIGETLEYVWRVEVDVMGWPAPPMDEGEGGDTRLDVYIEDLLSQGIAGYVDTAGGFLGDNPSSPETERQSAYGFMGLDNDYLDADYSDADSAMGLMQATVAHEFNHLIQAGIDDLDQNVWLYEATASWIEDEIFDDINDTVYYLDSVFKNPDICMVAEVARGDDLHWYGQWIFIRFLSERYGADLVRDIWLNMREYGGFGAVDRSLENVNSSLIQASLDYATANLLRAYEEGDLYPTVSIEGQAGIGAFTPRDGVQSLGVDYVQITSGGNVSVTLSSPKPIFDLQVVGIINGEADVFDTTNNIISFNRAAYEDAYVVVHNTERISRETSCSFANYSLDIAETTAASTPISQTLAVGIFASPAESPISSTAGEGSYRPPDTPYTGSSTETADSEEALEVGFATITPLDLPAGYLFDYAYIITEEDLGDNAIYYVPGGGITANFDYVNSDKGYWLSLAESPSPYASVQQWLDAIGYESPGEIRNIAGHEMLVEDLSDSEGPWFSITMILEGVFIVVDGDHSETDAVLLAEALVRAAEAGNIHAPSQGNGDNGEPAADFDPFEPPSAPPGYTFSETYILTAGDFGDNALFYTPSGLNVVNYDYLDGNNNWLSVAESPNEYSRLQEWLTAISYEPDGAFDEILGVEVLVEDLTDVEGPYFSVTFMYGDLFFVIDSDSNEKDARMMAKIIIEGLIARDQIPTQTPTEVPSPEPDVIEDTGSDGGRLRIVLIILCGAVFCLVGVIVTAVIALIFRGRKRT